MEGAYVVVLATSLMLIRGSALSGQRRMQGANTMARELGDMRLCGSSLETLQSVDKTVLKTYNNFVREEFVSQKKKKRFYLFLVHLHLGHLAHAFIQSDIHFSGETRYITVGTVRMFIESSAN